MKFVPDPNAGAEMGRSPGWAKHVLAISAATAHAAREAFEMQGPHPYSDAPVHYVDQIDASAMFVRGQVIGRVDAKADYSWYIEVGTSDTPAFAPLRLGADMVGLDLTGGP